MLARKLALLFAFAVQEGVGETNDELRSVVSCKQTSATAYQSGKAYTIQVINVGGKAVSKGKSTDAPLPSAGALKWVAPTQDSTKANGFVVKAHSTSPAIVKVVYSQGTVEFGTSTAASSEFSLSYTFQYMGDKTLTVKGYDASNTLLAEDNVDFTLT